jgi:decaprenyl-phosphate phosphoribosyltransferase
MKYLLILRPWQLVKNIIIFIPLLLTSQLGEYFYSTFFIFLYFSILVSGTYVINDLIDFKSDRNHPTKNKRPIASGDISKNQAIVYGVLLILFGLTQSFVVGFEIFFLFLTYLITTLFYSIYGKNIKFVDTTLISIFFLIRLFIGGSASDTYISIALALFLFFTSFSIGLAKKISIINDSDILKSNSTKKRLINNYSSTSLNSLIHSSSTLSVVTLIIWLVTSNFITLDSYQIFSLFIVIVLYYLFSILLIDEAKNGTMEDFVLGIFKNKTMSFLLILIIVLFYIGYLT